MVRALRELLLASALLLALTACGSNDPGESVSGGGPSGNPDQLVVLEDDKDWQPAENIVPVVRKAALTPPLEQALGEVSGALSQEALNDLNAATTLQRQSPEVVAERFVEDNGLADAASGGSGSVVVGAANFSESQVLAHVYALALEGAGFDAEVSTVGNRELYLGALSRGEISVMPEYAGTLAEFLNPTKNDPEPTPVATADVESTLEGLRPLADRAGLAVLEPAEAQNANAFAVTRRFAEDNDLRTLSDLADYEGELRLGGPPECPDRPFCQVGLEEVYGIEIDSFVSLDAGGPLTQTALKQGRIDVGLVFTSDPSLGTLEG